MADEFKLNHAMHWASQADNLLRNELLWSIFAEMNARYLQEWQITSVRDTDARERLWIAVNALAKVKDHLVKMIQDGKLAQREIDMLTERRKLEDA